MDLFIILTLLVTLGAACSYINERFIKLPGAIGIISIAICISVITLIIDRLNPDAAHHLATLAKDVDFPGAVLNIMLGFLLFAGSFNLNNQRLKKEMLPVFVLSTIGVIISAGIFGGLFYGITLLFNLHIPLIYCFLFGALISPTDPVAVAAVIKGSKLPQNLETIISGESLFNDGVGIVLFITILEIAQSGTGNFDISKTGLLFLKEVGGGIVLGIVMGFIAFRLMKSITDFQTIVLISLALVMGLSAAGTYFHLSVPLAVVSAGLFAGNSSINKNDTENTHHTLESFWELIDEMLNTVLFMMIGLQMLIIPYLDHYWLIGGIAIILLLMARWLSIMLPLTFLRRSLKVNYNSVNILTWAGLRGGVSIALALSLPASPYKYIILAGSYFIVIFSIIVQGLTLNKLIDSSFKK
ncbi:cation:proton antiporter [Mucilaginibacter sp. X5P1]|uniref:cation:proton antiporter n=1 Tax=Mucilaginibacter sp. X5P1 TaxID=2723088 RepID=UPI0016083467|nr:sodium:proton antiporter [Mucilaginibacter sp. X5P1]MBB6138348.1 CPA1 family monovalent cation:H+ antiporter [Mucilaginibacter sp. X5P1]